MVKRFNDVLALIVVIGVPVMIVGSTAFGVELSETAVGAFIVGFTLVLQFYFRKSEPK